MHLQGRKSTAGTGPIEDIRRCNFNLALLLQRKNEYAEAADYWRRYLANDCQSEWAARRVYH